MNAGGGHTRREAFAAAVVALTAHPATAFAADTERGPLAGLVAFQQAVAAEYAAALAKAPLAPGDRATLGRFRGEAGEAAAALRHALVDADGKPPAAADPAAIPPPPDPTRAAWLAAIIGAEQASVAACYAALQGLEDERHLRAATAFMAQAGRRLVVLRGLAGKPLLPRAFETGTS